MKRLVFTVIAVLFAAVFGANAQNSLTVRNDLAEAVGKSYQACESNAKKTQDAVPEVLTKSATIVSSGELMYIGYLDPNQSPAYAYFEWRYKGAGSFTAGTGYVVTASGQTANPTLEVGDVSKSVGGLTSDTIVEFRLRAFNSIGETVGNILSSPTSSGTLGQDAIAGVFTMEPINIAGDYATFRSAFVSNIPVRLFCEWDISGEFFNETTGIQQRSAGSAIVEFNVIGLTPGQSYDYRAVLLADDGTLVYADNIVTFTTLDATTGITEELIEEVQVKIFPNPVTHESQIRFGNENGMFTLYDVAGREVKKVVIEDGRGVLERGDLNPGFYIYQILGDDSRKVANGKVVIK